MAKNTVESPKGENASAAKTVATRLDPKLTFRLIPIRFESAAMEKPSEIVSIDSFGTSDLLHTTRETLDQSTLSLDIPVVDMERKNVWGRLLGDQTNFYSGQSLAELGLAFGAGALIANTNADSQIQRHFQSSVSGASSDEWFQFLHANKELGNGLYTLPIFGAAWLASEYIDGPPAFDAVGLWGERTTRGLLVGVPPMSLMQKLTGGSRPHETAEGSLWHPLRDNNGVSGHAFMSSLPFITAAKMTENPWQKAFWYTSSTIGPLSRLNDNAHYPSQIGLGWVMAYVAASAVQQTETGRRGRTLVPLASPTSSGVAMQYQW